MGLFDSIAGAVLGKMGGESGGMVQVAMAMFKQHGGLAGILAKFQAAGLAEQAASWVGQDENMPLSADQLASVLGSAAIAEMAAKFGIAPAILSAQIAQHLPTVIDKMTPAGEVTTDSGNLLASLLDMLK